ncbi:M15 family metallopeptidase [Halomonas dongshanensis]|uniref:D-alanyl-D-alanine dipeptidase n=1 Tax=Halomonas dongshanensis TaxID=2890835 RepID=A0ABT2E9E2_9GAMM|nr:M15 family metallopeptidase [Halomonas dongshanensis]MCS2608200.1 M15 family metallopeptidase [Halomonas dongshanensis]
MSSSATPLFDTTDLPAIPSRAAPDWAALRRLPIADNGERLLPMSLASAPVRVFPAYARLGIPGAVGECFVREGVFRALVAAARQLPAGLGLIVIDGWRPWRVQQYLFETLQAAIKHRHPDLDEAQLLERTREFVSIPSREPTAPSPHLTGGAVDVTLCDADGVPLDMGTLFDEALPASHTDHFERQENLTVAERQARDNRRLLYRIMCDQGFTNLPSEWWHFDFGDQLWGHYSGQASVPYGPTEPDTIENRWRRQLG